MSGIKVVDSEVMVVVKNSVLVVWEISVVVKVVCVVVTEGEPATVVATVVNRVSVVLVGVIVVKLVPVLVVVVPHWLNGEKLHTSERNEDIIEDRILGMEIVEVDDVLDDVDEVDVDVPTAAPETDHPIKVTKRNNPINVFTEEIWLGVSFIDVGKLVNRV